MRAAIILIGNTFFVWKFEIRMNSIRLKTISIKFCYALFLEYAKDQPLSPSKSSIHSSQPPNSEHYFILLVMCNVCIAVANNY